MVFINGTYDIPTIIATIAQGLAATDDFEMVDATAIDNHSHSGCCVKHIPTSTYVTLIAGYSNRGYNSGRTSNKNFARGIRVIFSDSFDTSTHTYTAATSIEYGIVPLFQTGGTSAPGVTVLYSPNQYGCSLWIDKHGVIASIQNNNGGYGCFFALEFFPRHWVEYDDAETPQCLLYCLPSDESFLDGNGTETINTYYTHNNKTADSGQAICRPYRYMGVPRTSLTEYTGGFKERQAYRSEANNKIYFRFHTYENDAYAEKKPYAETRRWFRVSTTGGLQVGDILNWIDPDAVTVHKYIVTLMSADDYYAIPYENAFEYPSS